MCRALRIMCAASDSDRLAVLKKAAGSAHWEVVGGAASMEELPDKLGEWNPDVVVLDGAMGAAGVRVVRGARPEARIVTLGPEEAGGDAAAETMEDIRRAVLELPRMGGPVKR